MWGCSQWRTKDVEDTYLLTESTRYTNNVCSRPDRNPCRTSCAVTTIYSGTLSAVRFSISYQFQIAQIPANPKSRNSEGETHVHPWTKEE